MKYIIADFNTDKVVKEFNSKEEVDSFIDNNAVTVWRADKKIDPYFRVVYVWVFDDAWE